MYGHVINRGLFKCVSSSSSPACSLSTVFRTWWPCSASTLSPTSTSTSTPCCSARRNHNLELTRSYSARPKYERSPYEILGLHQQATRKEIKTAYIRLSKLYHPDRNPGNPDAGAEFNKIREAYDKLIALQAEREREGGGGEDDFDDYRSENNTYYNETVNRRRRVRSVDDWIKEVERNARLRNQKSSSTNSQNSSQNSSQNHSESLWGEEFERDYKRFETRFSADLDRAIKISRVRHIILSEDQNKMARRWNIVNIVYLTFLKYFFRYGAKFLLLLTGVLFIYDSSFD